MLKIPGLSDSLFNSIEIGHMLRKGIVVNFFFGILERIVEISSFQQLVVNRALPAKDIIHINYNFMKK